MRLSFGESVLTNSIKEMAVGQVASLPLDHSSSSSSKCKLRAKVAGLACVPSVLQMASYALIRAVDRDFNVSLGTGLGRLAFSFTAITIFHDH